MMKRILSLIIILLFSLSFNGCNIKQVVNISPQNKLVRKSVKANYLIPNDIKMNEVRKTINTGKGQISFFYLEFNGFRDKTLENSLNKSIEKDIENEIKAYLTETAEADEGFAPFYCRLEFNANNLLSISIYSYYDTPIYGLLYRLSDGKRLYLKDIFTKGTDYVSLLNEKVILGIIGGDRSEEDILREPFSTIKPNQTFALSQTMLYIIFHRGEAGFADRNSIGIPLSSIDDYVDIIDKYAQNGERSPGESNSVVKYNNIFATDKQVVLKSAVGKVFVTYPLISGIRDSAFEKIINDTIWDGINKATNNKLLYNTANSNKTNEYIASVRMYISCNHYGILCLDMTAYSNFQNISSQNLTASYTFDLIKKKPIDVKDILISYASKHKEFRDALVSCIRSNLITSYGPMNKEFIGQVNSKIDFSFIMDNGSVQLSNYYFQDDTSILIHFKDHILNNTPNVFDSQVPLKKIIKTSTEDFFGRR